MDPFWIAAIVLPFLGALHRYAVSYGYRGVSRKEAFLEARQVFAGLTFFVSLFALAHVWPIR